MAGNLNVAEQNLDRLKSVLSEGSLTFADIEPSSMAVGLGIPFDETSYAVVTISGTPNDTHTYITAGVLRDIDRDRDPSVVLKGCNDLTSNNPAFPTFLHDAEIGWDVLIQNSFPVQLLVDVPEFFFSCVSALPSAANDARLALVELGIGGHPYRWNKHDVDRLFVCSFV